MFFTTRFPKKENTFSSSLLEYIQNLQIFIIVVICIGMMIFFDVVASIAVKFYDCSSGF